MNSGPRHTSFGGQSASSGQSPMLVARINEKKAELENLKQLRDLSANLAAQMQTLEEKLSTLSDGTQVKVPKPKVAEGGAATEIISENTLPQTLVRIPVEQEPSLSQSQEGSSKEP
ncbi:MAG: hypothetical protein Q9166_001565 [cf. Caloplaca sp. 2 TL-2023]